MISESIRRILTFGYLFLILIGLIGECVFYNKMGVNILRYSSISDIMISPIATLVTYPPTLIFILVVIIMIFSLSALLYKLRNQPGVLALSGFFRKGDVTEHDITNHYINLPIVLTAVFMAYFFLNTARSFGNQITDRVKNGTLKYRSKLTFNSGEVEQVYLMHTNSMYFFYIPQGSKNIKIAPIGTIKTNEITDNLVLK